MKTGIAWFAGTAAGLSPIQRPGSIKKDGVSRTSLKPLQVVPTTCEQCPAGCGINAYLNGERLVQLLGNPDHPNNQGGICAKGIAGLNLVNDPERLLYPLMRKGPRGEGQWTRITWDEVYSTLAARLKKMIREGRINEFVIDKGHDDPLLDRFISAIGATRTIDRPGLKNLNRTAALTSMTGFPSLVEDVGRSRFILNFGANPYANHDQFVGIARRLIHARVEKGARLITFDVRMSETAAKSDAWYPIKAGTDGIVALAMAKVIVEKGLVNEDFMDRKTNTSLTMIKNHLSQYTPEKAAEESGVRAADIEHLAVEFATQKPSMVLIGGGISDHKNGTQNVRSVALLNWLVGNLEKEGGLFYPRYPASLEPNAAVLRPRLNSDVNVKGIKELKETNTRINTYFAYLSNPAYVEPDCESTASLLKDEKTVPFLVVMDTHLTETALLADMALPAATYLEGWGLSTAPSLDKVPILNLRQPVVFMISTAKVLRSPTFDVGKLLEPMFRPRGEAEEVGNVCLELARRIKGRVARNLPYKNTQDYITRLVYSISGLKTEGGLKNLKTQGFWTEKTSNSGGYRYSGDKELPASRQKVEIYSKALKQNGYSPLPDYEPLFAPEKKKDEFILTTFKSNLWAKGTANSKWVREILHENRLWINKDVARRLGIKNGERVRVTSSVGSLVSRVLTTHRIHPWSVAMAEGLGHSAVGKVAKGKRFKSNDQDTNLIWWDKKGNGVNPNEIIVRQADPIGGGLGLKDTRVRIERI
ncbi:MAG: molybdopterin-dependent oxidoreductase [Candidatus Aminicenantes bacterium]|nr:molybdopterin-dependent oxidoreductase [Candidatus Aminicenantes bacterium]